MGEVDDYYGKAADRSTQRRIPISVYVTKELREEIDKILAHPLAGQLWSGGLHHFAYSALWMLVNAHDLAGFASTKAGRRIAYLKRLAEEINEARERREFAEGMAVLDEELYEKFKRHDIGKVIGHLRFLREAIESAPDGAVRAWVEDIVAGSFRVNGVVSDLAHRCGCEFGPPHIHQGCPYDHATCEYIESWRSFLEGYANGTPAPG